jgi:hypothetical protein
MANPVVTQVVMDANTITTIINNINSMYSSLITYTVGLVAFIGILLPIVITLLQNRQLKNDHKALSDKISSELDAVKAKLLIELKSDLTVETKKLDNKAAEMKNELNVKISEMAAELHAKAHHIQARVAIDKNRFDIACLDCLYAIVGYCEAKDEANLQAVSEGVLMAMVVPHLKKLDFEENEIIEKKLIMALAAIEKINVNGRYDGSLKALRSAFKAAKVRQA